MTFRRILASLGFLLLADVVLVVITGNLGILGVATRSGFAWRLAGLGVFAALWWRLLAAASRPARTPLLVLFLFLLPTLYQFQFAGGRINGDGLMYYPYVRSLWKDFDLDFTNEYAHLGLLERGDLRVPTKTGLRRSIFSIGPAVVWTPFFWVGEAVGRGLSVTGFPVDLSGFGPTHRNAVALGSLVYGFAALVLIHGTLRRHFDPGTALGATLLVWGATFLHWYMVQQPTMSHAPSAFAAALVVFLWDRDRGRRSATGFLYLGLALGLAMCIRWQNGVLFSLPALEVATAAWRERRITLHVVSSVGLLFGGAFVTAFPQMAAWKALYDEWLLRYPPHGRDFLRLDHPFIVETLFSSRHGLLSWTPVFWAGYLGMAPLFRRRATVAATLLVPLALMTYVNFCSGDWWAGGSFSNRRFDSLLPIFAFGFAASIDVARTAVARRPWAAVAALSLLAISWNATLMAQVRRGMVPRDDTVSFPRLMSGSAKVVSDAVGFPTTWPASLWFAARFGLSPSQFDTAFGKYLFYRQNNLRGHVGISDLDQPLLAEGFFPVTTESGRACRRLRSRARFLAPLDVPEALEMRFAVAGGGERVSVEVNGRSVGEIACGTAWSSPALVLAAPTFRSGLNEVLLGEGEGCCVASVDFRRLR